MTKKQAAKFLGVSERTLERYAGQNLLGVRYEKGKTRRVPVYDRADLERFKAEMEKPQFRPSVEAPPPASEATALTVQDGDVIPTAPDRGLAEFVGFVAGRTAEGLIGQLSLHVPLADKLTLSLKEAAAVAGLSRGFLLIAIRDGSLKAEKRGRGWNVKRADLEAWVKKL